MKKIIFFTLILIFLLTGQVMADDLLNKELYTEAEGVSVRITILHQSGSCLAASSWLWGAENECPKTFIGAIEVKVNDTPVFVSLSAFADLGNPRTVQIKQSKKKDRFSVVIIGGELVNSYTASLEFRNNLLHERVVRSGEFPDEAYEKTFYKYNLTTR